MEPSQTHAVLAAVIGVVFVASIYRLGRRQTLSFRYTVGWLVLGMLSVVAGLLVPLAEPLADLLNLTPAALLGLGGMLLLLTLCVQLSISISGLQEQMRTVVEELSFLRARLDRQDHETSSSE